MSNQVESYVKSELHSAVTIIEFYNAQANSVTGRMLDEIAQAIHAANIDAASKVILLRSAGQGNFCGGASFTELSNLKNTAEATDFFSGFGKVINAIRLSPKFVVGRIHGKAVGGGVGLAAAVDYAISVEGADIKLSELSLGFGPFVIGPAVERKIGQAAFAQLAIDAGIWRNADWARRKGLYAELHPSITEMDESVSKLLFSLSHYSPEAMKELKKIFWNGTEHWNELLDERAAISAKLSLTEASKKAIAAFSRK